HSVANSGATGKCLRMSASSLARCRREESAGTALAPKGGCEETTWIPGWPKARALIGGFSLCTSQARKIGNEIVQLRLAQPVAEAWHQALASLLFNATEVCLAEWIVLVGSVARLYG